MPKSITRRPWFFFDLFAALQRLRLFLTRRTDGSGREHNPLKVTLELTPLDQRNPPSEGITTVILPLAALSAGLTADAYHEEAVAAAEEQAALSTGDRDETEDKTDKRTSHSLIGGAGFEEEFPVRGGSQNGLFVPRHTVTSLEDDWATTTEWSSDFMALPTGGTLQPSEAQTGTGGSSDPGTTPVRGQLTTSQSADTSFGQAGATSDLLGRSTVSTSEGLSGAGQESTASLHSVNSDTSTESAPVSTSGNVADAAEPTLSPGGSAPGSEAGEGGTPMLLGNLTEQPVRFVANEGQWGETIDFAVRGQGYQASFGRDGVGLALARQATLADVARGEAPSTSAIVYDMVRLSWQGAGRNQRERRRDRVRSRS